MSSNNTFFTLQKGFLALMSAALLFSCSQIEPFEMEDMKVLRSTASTASSEDFCVSAFPMEAVEVYSNAARGVTVTAKNDADSTYFTITRSTGNMTVRVATPGVEVTQTNKETILEGGTTVTVSVPHKANWNRGDIVTVSFYVSGLGGGSDNRFQTGIISYNLRDICSDCVENFSYINNGNGSYTFTYVSEEDINDAQLVLTFAQGVVVEGLDNWSTNGSTRQLMRDINKCEKYKWTVGLVTDCNGQGQNSANLWTDFKVNGVSKKGELDNIVKSCN